MTCYTRYSTIHYGTLDSAAESQAHGRLMGMSGCGARRGGDFARARWRLPSRRVGLECSPASAWQLSQGARRTPLAGADYLSNSGTRVRGHLCWQRPDSPDAILGVSPVRGLGGGPSRGRSPLPGHPLRWHGGARTHVVGDGAAQQLMKVARGGVVVIVVLDCRAPTRVDVGGEGPEELEGVGATTGHLGSRAPLGTGRVHGKAAGMGHRLIDRLAHEALDLAQTCRGEGAVDLALHHLRLAHLLQYRLEDHVRLTLGQHSMGMVITPRVEVLFLDRARLVGIDDVSLFISVTLGTCGRDGRQSAGRGIKRKWDTQ